MGTKDLLLAFAGLLLVLLSIKGRVWAALYLGGRAGKVLVTEGPYARCRHPLCFYNLLGATGIASASGMLSIVAAVGLLCLLANFFLVRSEERMLRSTFGDAYERYCRLTPQFWPQAEHYAELPLHEFSPREFHRAFWDAIGFLAGWLLVVAAHLFSDVHRFPG